MLSKVSQSAVAALATTTGVASAYDAYGPSDYRGDRIDRLQDRQYQRILRANRAGELTRYERRRLIEEQDRIYNMERRAKSDGYITPREARVIREAQDDASRHIRRESRDWDYRW